MSDLASNLDAARDRLQAQMPAPTALRVASEPLRPFFTTRTLAEYLAISERTARQMLSDRRIPSYKVEGARRVDPADVAEYLARNRMARG